MTKEIKYPKKIVYAILTLFAGLWFYNVLSNPIHDNTGAITQGWYAFVAILFFVTMFFVILLYKEIFKKDNSISVIT